MAVTRSDNCKACLEPIFKEAHVCPKCGSFQDWRRHVAWSVAPLSLVLGLALGIPTLYEIRRLVFYTPPSKVSVVEIQLDTEGLTASVGNFGENLGVLAKELNCIEKRSGPGTLSLRLLGPRVSMVLPHNKATVTWDIWNAYVQGATRDDPTSEKIMDVAKGLISEHPPLDRSASEEVGSLTEALSQGPFAPMYDPFRYYLVLAGKLKLSAAREVPEEFSFSCQVAVTDGTEESYLAQFDLSFGVGNYGLDDEVVMTPAASP